MMHGMLPDSAIVGTAKRMSRKPRSRKMGKKEGAVVSVFSVLAAILSF